MATRLRLWVGILCVLATIVLFWETRSNPGVFLVDKEECRAVGHEGVTFWKNASTHYPMGEIVEGPGLNRTDSRAACKFVEDNHSDHFPHTMQQLLRCFSYWNANPGDEKYFVAKHMPPNEFVKGFMLAMKEAYQLLQVRFRGDLKVVRPLVDYGFDYKPHLGYQVASANDIPGMRETIMNHYQLYGDTTAGCPKHQRAIEHPLPVIGILNRHRDHGRTLLNIDLLKEKLEQRFRTIVKVEYFEDKSFLGQVVAMSEIDILISPHGAQLTGIPFMQPCGRVLELFPVGYHVPEFFGSLAVASGLNYSYIYTGQNREVETKLWMKDLDSRTVARLFPVCADTDIVLEAVKEHILGWYKCCHIDP